MADKEREPTLEELQRRVDDAMLDYMNALPEGEREAFAERARAIWRAVNEPTEEA
jgi:hypothetical protein